MTVIDHAGRLARLRREMGELGIDVVLLSIGADLLYLTGYEAMASERPTVLVVGPAGDPTLFVPRLEAPRVASGPFELVAWEESDDPLALVARAAGSPRRAAVGDPTWARFLIGMQRLLPGVEWSAASELTKALRIRKDDAELEALRQAAEAVDRVIRRVPGELRFAGRKEAEVSWDLAGMTLAEGHEQAAHAIVASGPNGASPHHGAGDRIIEPGDLVVCDFGGRLDGYFSDVTRTFSVGEPSSFQSEVHEVVRMANQAGHAAVAPGVSCQQVDRAARQVIADAGYGEFFVHRTGHGIGLDVHEHPYMVEGNSTPLEEGMTFSIEPGIYLPGRLGVRIEDVVACGSSGADSLNKAARDLIVVG